MDKLVYIYVQYEFVIGQVVLKLLIKGLAVAMVNKTVGELCCLYFSNPQSGSRLGPTLPRTSTPAVTTVTGM
jgi:hypothetical protein